MGLDLDAAVYAVDASIIDLCLSPPPWAPLRATKDAIKMQTLLDLHGSMPRNTSVICDQIGVLTDYYSRKDYPAAWPRLVVKNEAGKRITF